MKVALLTDTHFGARNDNQAIANYFNKFYQETFFPYLDEHNIKHFIHLGDVVDRRKYINFVTARNLKNMLVNPLLERGIDCTFIIGNHDTYFKNTNEVNSLTELYGDSNIPNLDIVWEPKTKRFGDTDILLMPWICSGNYDQCLEAINGTKAQVLFGHLEIKGFTMYRGSVNLDGFDPKSFDRFDTVCSGHFHHRSSVGNIHYIGNPYEIVWSDYEDARGFCVFDTETREIEFIRNPHKLFHKIHYDDMNKEMEEVLSEDYSEFANSFIKIVVRNKTNPYWFDLLIDKLEKAQPIDIQVVDDHFNLDMEDDDDIVDQAEDTMTILHKYVDTINTKVNKPKLDKLLRDLYNEALSVE